MDQLYIAALEHFCPQAVPAGCLDCFYIVEHEARREVIRRHAEIWSDMSCRRFVFCGAQAHAWAQGFDDYDVERHLHDEVYQVTDTDVADSMQDLAQGILSAMENAGGTVHQVLVVCDDEASIAGLQRIAHVYDGVTFPAPEENYRENLLAELQITMDKLEVLMDDEPERYDTDAYAEWEHDVEYLSELIADMKNELGIED